MLLGSGGGSGTWRPLKCTACDLWSSSFDYWLSHITSESHLDRVADREGNEFSHEAWLPEAQYCLKVAEAKGLSVQHFVTYLAKWGTITDLAKGVQDSTDFYFVKYESEESVNKILNAQKKVPHQVQGRQIFFRRKYDDEVQNKVEGGSQDGSQKTSIGLLASEYWDEDDTALGALQSTYQDEDATSPAGGDENVVQGEGKESKDVGQDMVENHEKDDATPMNEEKEVSEKPLAEDIVEKEVCHDLFSQKMIDHLSASLKGKPLEEQLEAFCKTVLLPEPFFEGRRRVIEELAILLKKRYPKIVLHPCGMDQIGISCSDDPVQIYLDLFDNVLSEQKQAWETNPTQHIPQVLNALKVEEDNLRFCNKVTQIDDGITFSHLSSGIKVSLRFNGYPMVQEATLIKFLCSLDPRVPPLLAITRYWATVNKLFDKFPGSDDSKARFAMLLMIFHLSNRNVLPTMAKLQSEAREKIIFDGVDLSFCDDKTKLKLPSPNPLIIEDKSIMTLSTLSLLKDFFERFGIANLKDNAVSLWYGKFVQKKHLTRQTMHLLPDDYCTKLRFGPNGDIMNDQINLGDADHYFSVQDLFDIKSNIGITVGTAEIQKFQMTSWRSGEKMETILNNNDKQFFMDLFIETEEDIQLKKEQELAKQQLIHEIQEKVRKDQERLLQMKKQKEEEARRKKQQQEEEERRKRSEEEERRRQFHREREKKRQEEEKRRKQLRNEEEQHRLRLLDLEMERQNLQKQLHSDAQRIRAQEEMLRKQQEALNCDSKRPRFGSKDNPNCEPIGEPRRTTGSGYAEPRPLLNRPDQIRRERSPELSRQVSNESTRQPSKRQADDWLNTEWEEFSRSLDQPTSFIGGFTAKKPVPVAPVSPSKREPAQASRLYNFLPPPPPPPRHNLQYEQARTTTGPSAHSGIGIGPASGYSGSEISRAPLRYDSAPSNLAHNHDGGRRKSIEFMDSDSSSSDSLSDDSESEDEDNEMEQGEGPPLPSEDSRIRNPFYIPKAKLSPFTKNLFIEAIASRDFAYGIRGKLQTLFLQFMKEFNNRFWKNCFGFEIELEPTYQDTNPADYAKFGDRRSVKMVELLSSVPCYEDNFISAFYCQSAGKLSNLLVNAQPSNLRNGKYIRKQSGANLKVLMDEVPPNLVRTNQNIRFKVEVCVILDYVNLNKDCQPFVQLVFEKGLSPQNEMLALYRFMGKLYSRMSTKFINYCLKRWLGTCIDFDLRATEKKCRDMKMDGILDGKSGKKTEKRRLKRLKKAEKKKQQKMLEEQQLAWSTPTLPPLIPPTSNHFPRGYEEVGGSLADPRISKYGSSGRGPFPLAKSYSETARKPEEQPNQFQYSLLQTQAQQSFRPSLEPQQQRLAGILRNPSRQFAERESSGYSSQPSSSCLPPQPRQQYLPPPPPPPPQQQYFAPPPPPPPPNPSRRGGRGKTFQVPAGWNRSVESSGNMNTYNHRQF